jgi:hypothetical protein
MKRFATSFCLFSAACWGLGSAGYFLLVRIMPDGYVFGAGYRMFVYHEQHPYQYILVVAVAYGFSAAVWARFLGHLTGVKRIASIFAVILVALLLASVPGGLLWGIHDVQAGFVPPVPVLRRNLIWAATTGLTFGWVIIGLSIPYNIIGCFTGYAVTHYGQKILDRRTGLTPS